VPATPDAAEKAAVTPEQTAPEGLRFNFSGAPWGEVLRWFAEQADLSLQLDAAPAGSVNFSDPTKVYSISEGLDLLNRLLLDRGWAVVRRGRMLLLVDLEADNAEKLISEMAELVTPESFDDRGNSDIVRCVFSLGSITPEQAREELSQIIGPWGRINVLAGARQVIVTETVGKLRVIDEVLRAATKAQSSVIEITLAHRAAEEVLEIARPLIGLEPGSNSSEDIKLSVSLYGDRIFATGSQSKLDLLTSVIEKADRAMPGEEEAVAENNVKPELRTHPVSSAELQTVYDVLQTLIAGTPDTRLALDTNRGAIIAFGRPETQQTIAKTIAELEGTGTDFTIIDLKRLEPANALLTINKFFGVTETSTGKGPIVDGDPVTGRLWVRGTSEQIESVKRLINELENDPLAGGLGENVRILPLTGSSALDTLQQIETLWPLTGRANRIRVITPSKAKESPADSDPAEQTEPKQPADLTDQSVESSELSMQTLVWQNTAAPENEPAPDYTGDDIIIQMTPAGLVIASRDQNALDLVEQLITSMSSGSEMTSDLPTIFWLRYIKADVAAELVSGVLGGADAGSSAGSLTESVMGGLGGGMLGGLLGMGGGGGGEDESQARTILTSRGSVNIVPDNRLNALIVQAPPADMDFIRTVLQEIDLQESPEVIQTIARPTLIPVVYQDAASVAKIVQAVFAEKIGDGNEGGGGGGRGGQPNPQDIINALRGGRGGGGGGAPTPKSEMTKIIVAVDERSNSLVVTATPQDLTAVRDLVETLDQQGLESEQRVEVIAMGGAVRPEIMLQALKSVTGKAVTTTDGSSSGSSTSGSAPSSSSPSPPGSTSSAEEIQRRIEFFRSQFGSRGGDSGGRGGPPGGGGDSGGRGGGGSSSSRGGGRGR
jgi:type II secretory pathway component GspD/PulD (secretin)